MIFLDAENAFANLECVRCAQQTHTCEVQAFLLFSAYKNLPRLAAFAWELLHKARRHSGKVRPCSLVFMRESRLILCLNPPPPPQPGWLLSNRIAPYEPGRDELCYELSYMDTEYLQITNKKIIMNRFLLQNVLQWRDVLFLLYFYSH